MKILGKYVKEFLIRGLVAMGFGPIVLSIVYGILGICGLIDYMSVTEVVLGFLTVTLLAFLCGSATAVYQIEEIAISKAITIHGIALYIAYAVVYLTNGWLKEGVLPFLVFTGIFIVGYALVWLIIYLITNRSTKNVNNRLKNRAE